MFSLLHSPHFVACCLFSTLTTHLGRRGVGGVSVIRLYYTGFGSVRAFLCSGRYLFRVAEHIGSGLGTFGRKTRARARVRCVRAHDMTSPQFLSLDFIVSLLCLSAQREGSPPAWSTFSRSYLKWLSAMSHTPSLVLASICESGRSCTPL